MATRLNGVIKRLATDKGFGFVRGDTGVEYFFHRSAVSQPGFDSLHEGDHVTFEEEESAKGPRAMALEVA